MTVSNQTQIVTANGNGVATSFSFSPMEITVSTDLVVVKEDTSGVLTTLSEGSGTNDYTVVVSTYPGTGSITYPSTGATRLENGESLYIQRILTLEQATELENLGRYFPKTQERQFDKVVMIDQQQQAEIDRSFRLDINETGITTTLPTPTASYYWRWNATGDAIEFAQTVEEWLNGSGVPSSVLGNNGDYYIDNDNGNYYEKQSGSWVLLGSLQGADGTSGADGLGVIRFGTGVPSGGLGNDGDYYKDTANGDYYGKATGSWTLQGNDTGPTGATGSTGAAGADGTNGNTVLNGAGAPSGGTGVDGDFYIDTTNDEIYGPKTGGVWGSGTSLIGPTGATGAAGADGQGVPVGGTAGQGLTKIDGTDYNTQWSSVGTLNNIVEDTSPQLGGNLDINGFLIQAPSSNDLLELRAAGSLSRILLSTIGAGSTIDIDYATWPAADGSADQVLSTDGAGNLSWVANSGGGGLANVVDDTTPQLGGDLDYNSFDIVDASTNEVLGFVSVASAVNYTTVSNAATSGDPIITSAGDDTNVGLELATKGNGEIHLNANTTLGTNRLECKVGSAISPSIIFGDGNSGIFGFSSSVVFTSDGTENFRISGGQATSPNPIRVGDGSVTIPGYGFNDDTNSGMYRIGADNIGFTVNSALVLDVDTAGIGVTGDITLSGSVNGTTDSIATKAFWSGTQVAYDAIGTPDANTIYFITG